MYVYAYEHTCMPNCVIYMMYAVIIREGYEKVVIFLKTCMYRICKVT